MARSSVQFQVISMLLLFYPGGLFAFKLGFCVPVSFTGYYRGKLIRSSNGHFRLKKKRKILSSYGRA